MIWFSVCLILVISPIYGYRILAIITAPSYSHQEVFKPLWRELSLRGHQVTVLTSHPMNDPTLSDLIEIDSSSANVLASSVNVTDFSAMNRFQMYDFSMVFGNNLTDFELNLPQVRALIGNQTEHFDVVISEYFYPTMFAFAERFKCPLIAVSTLEGMSRTYNAMGNPYHPLVNSESLSPSNDYSTFYQRFLTTVYSFYVKYFSYYIYGEEQDKIVKKHFGVGYPSVEELERNISMLFINTDFLFHNIHPLLPSIVSIGGGFHVKPSKPLPDVLQKQCDDARNGFIYFSLGSNVKSNLLPKHTIRLLLETFAELPYTIFWKFESNGLLDKPSNVVADKWFPQQSLLEHPNIKLFITQGGLHSLHEAILNEVPVVGIPFVSDQQRNLERIVAKEIGVMLSIDTITKEALKSVILEVAGTPKYKNNVKKYAALLKDEPMSGLEKAVWWTEYVIRHKGAKHFRSYGAEISFYQYLLLDVIGFCLAVIGLLIAVLVFLLKLSIKLFYKTFCTKPKRE